MICDPAAAPRLLALSERYRRLVEMWHGPGLVTPGDQILPAPDLPQPQAAGVFR